VTKREDKTSGSAATRARARSAEMRAAAKAAERKRQALMQGGLIGGVVVIVLAIVVVVLMQRDDTAKAIVGAPPGVSSEGTISVGSATEPVTVTMIEDFQCPICREFEAANKTLLDGYAKAGSGVRLEYRPIAFLDQMSTTNYSSRALNAAACFQAADPKQWRDFHTVLYDNQPAEQSAGLTDGQLTDLAVQAGASRDKVASCISGNSYAKWVKSTTDVATHLSYFQGTPTVLVNGKKVDNPTSQAIEAAVAAARK